MEARARGSDSKLAQLSPNQSPTVSKQRRQLVSVHRRKLIQGKGDKVVAVDPPAGSHLSVPIGCRKFHGNMGRPEINVLSRNIRSGRYVLPPAFFYNFVVH